MDFTSKPDQIRVWRTDSWKKNQEKKKYRRVKSSDLGICLPTLDRSQIQEPSWAIELSRTRNRDSPFLMGQFDRMVKTLTRNYALKLKRSVSFAVLVFIYRMMKKRAKNLKRCVCSLSLPALFHLTRTRNLPARREVFVLIISN